MSIAELRSGFIEELLASHRKLRTLFDARVKNHGLTLSRAQLLLHLATAEGATQAELAVALEVEQPSMVGLIDGLEKMGYIERRPIEGDRRARAIYLTDAARSKAEEMLGFAAKLREDLLKDVDEKEIEIAIGVLQKLTRNIGGLA